jgi:hypothetical protein
MTEIDLFSAARGAVTAPAGCGKTQLIADSLAAFAGTKPVLVLTHTNAGKAALQARLQRAEVQAERYRVATIDSWAIRTVSMFPGRARCDPSVLRLDDPQRDYPAVRDACGRLLAGRHIDDILEATYSRLVVDEYQDCTLRQHQIIDSLACVLPTSVLGDPLQAIFGFREPTVHWEDHVHARFPAIGRLDVPWRWRNAQCERLGVWLLQCRDLLLAGHPIDLRTAPPEVTWVQIKPATAAMQRAQAARVDPPVRGESVLIIGDSRNPAGQRAMASQTPGATAVDAVDFRDLAAFARNFDETDAASLRGLASFCGELMSNVGVPALLQRVDTLARGAERRPADAHEAAALRFTQAPSVRAALDTVQEFSRAPGVRVYRPEALRVLLSALQRAATGAVSLAEAVSAAREQNRHRGRLVSRRAVGSTLLLKGLESDVAVILDPAPMDRKHLYVALTRGAKRLVVCSEQPLLAPTA